MINNDDAVPVDEKGKANENVKGVNKEANVSGEGKQKNNLGDTRKDSITDRPKTETYEKGNDTAEEINKANYKHAEEEAKREKENNLSHK